MHNLARCNRLLTRFASYVEVFFYVMLTCRVLKVCIQSSPWISPVRYGGQAVAQLVQALRYKLEDAGLIPAAVWPWGWLSLFEIIKRKGTPNRPEGPEGGVEVLLYSFLTSALEGGGWSAPRPGRFTPGKDPVPIVHEAGWTPGLGPGRVRKISPPSGFDPRTVQPVASRTTDWATPTAI
jgi:hypothetical protein